MANSNTNTTTVQWSASSSKSLNSSARVDSDAVTIHADAVQGSLQITVDNSGTPASGDVVNLWVKWSADGTNYDTDEHAQPLSAMDTVAANTPGEDPATRTYTLNVSGKQKFKLSSAAPQGGTRAITISAAYNEHRMA